MRTAINDITVSYLDEGKDGAHLNIIERAYHLSNKKNSCSKPIGLIPGCPLSDDK